MAVAPEHERGVSGKLTSAEGAALMWLMEFEDDHDDLPWHYVQQEHREGCAGLDECGLAELNVAVGVRLTTAGWARGIGSVAGRIGHELGLQHAAAERTIAPLVDGYPPGWPRCPGCGKPALDGHITCGDAGCDEGGRR